MKNRIIIDENQISKLPVRERLEICTRALKNEKDESSRFDAVWIAGEIAEANPNSDIFDEVADLMAWVLQNDDNGVVKHEACYQIAALNMRNKIPDLIRTALNDKSVIAKHEALEALGLIGDFGSKDMLLKVAKDSNPDIRETARLALKRLQRLEKIAVNK